MLSLPRPFVWRELTFGMRMPSLASPECESASLLMCVKQWRYDSTSVYACMQ